MQTNISLINTWDVSLSCANFSYQFQQKKELANLV